MFDGLANEAIQLCEWYLNHPMTKVGLALFVGVFAVVTVVIIITMIRMSRNRRRRF